MVCLAADGALVCPAEARDSADGFDLARDRLASEAYGRAGCRADTTGNMNAGKPLFKQLDLVVFDLAGTTLRIGDQIPEAFREAFREQGIMLSESEILDIRGRSKREAILVLLEKHFGLQATDMTEMVHERFLQLLDQAFSKKEVEAIAGSEETFHWLKERKLRIALNTGFERRFAMLLLERIDWIGIADAVVCGDEVPRGRPAPDLIIESMIRSGCSDASRVSVVGDTRADLEAAEKAGVRLAVGVLSGAHDEEQLKTCAHDAIIPGVIDLPELLSGTKSVLKPFFSQKNIENT